MGNRFRGIAITAVIMVFSAWGSPDVRAAEGNDTKQTVTETTIKSAKQKLAGDAKAAITTKNSLIDTQELELTVKPLTIEELSNEALGWMLLLKEKQKEIANTEIAVVRQNLAIKKQKEALGALEEAQQSLAEAEKGQANSAPGSPEYEAAAQKIEEAKENINKAQEAIKEASIAQKTLKNEKRLSTALKQSAQTEELESSNEVLETAKKARDELVTGSFLYEQATKKIDKLQEAILAFEKAEKAEKNAKPNSAEEKQAKKKLETAQAALKKAREAIKLTEEDKPKESQKNSQKLDKTAADVGKIDINTEKETKVAGTPSVNKDTKQLEQKGQQLEQSSEKLENNLENESELKIQLVNSVTTLQSERTGIIDRFNIVLNELDLKGGDSKPYREYIQAVGGVKVNVEDTQGLQVRIVSWLKSSQGGLRWGQNLLKFLGIVLIFFVVSQVLGVFVNILLKKFGNTTKVFREFVVMLIKRGGIVVGVMLGLTALEISFGPILALVGGVSFILAFALQSNLSNFASGLLILAYKPFDVGDEIEINNLFGEVESITLANTNIQGLSGERYIVPNNDVWNNVIVNMTSSSTGSFKITLQVDLKQDLSVIEKLMIETAKSHPDVLENPEPRFVVAKIESYYIRVFVKGSTKTVKNRSTFSSLNRMIIDKFQQEGVPLAAIYPQEINLKFRSDEQLPDLIKLKNNVNQEN